MELMRLVVVSEYAALQARLAACEQALWVCGCGWTNGVNLAVCARCNRTPNEGNATPFQHDLYTKLVQAEARVQALEQARIKYGPICVVCGAMEPCNLQSDPHSPCTFDPAPRELYERCKKLEQENARLKEALQEMVNMEAAARCGASEEYLLHEWPKRYKAACEKAEHALEGG